MLIHWHNNVLQMRSIYKMSDILNAQGELTNQQYELKLKFLAIEPKVRVYLIVKWKDKSFFHM